MGPTGTLGQIRLNPPGRLFVTTRIPFAPNEGTNELRCLPPPGHSHSHPRACISARFFPGRKGSRVCKLLAVCRYRFGYFRLGQLSFTSNPPILGQYLTHLMRLRGSRMLRPREPWDYVNKPSHLERSRSCDTARPRKQAPKVLFCRLYCLSRTIHTLYNAQPCLQSTHNPGRGRKQMTKNRT